MKREGRDDFYDDMSAAQREMADRLIREFNRDAEFATGYQGAFAGILHRCGSFPSVAVYDVDKCLEILIEVGDADHSTVMDVFCHTALRGMRYEGENGEAFIHFACNDAACYEEAEEIDEFEGVLLGLVEHNGTSAGMAGYDKKESIAVIMQRDVISSDEAEEVFRNLLSSFTSKNAPTFIELVDGYDFPTFTG